MMSKSAKWFSRRHHAPTYERIGQVLNIWNRLDPKSSCFREAPNAPLACQSTGLCHGSDRNLDVDPVRVLARSFVELVAKTFRSGLRWKRGPLGPRRMRLPKGAFRPGAPRSDFLKHAVGFLNAENPNAASGNPAITPGKVPIQTPTMFVREAPITDKDKTPSLLISDHLITNPNGRRGRPTLNHRTISSRKAYHLVILSDMAF